MFFQKPDFQVLYHYPLGVVRCNHPTPILPLLANSIYELLCTPSTPFKWNRSYQRNMLQCASPPLPHSREQKREPQKKANQGKNCKSRWRLQMEWNAEGSRQDATKSAGLQKQSKGIAWRYTPPPPGKLGGWFPVCGQKGTSIEN